MNEKLDVNSTGQYWKKNEDYWCSFDYYGILKLVKCFKNEYGLNFVWPCSKDRDEIDNPNLSWFDDAKHIEYVPKIRFTPFDFLPQTHENLIKNMNNPNINYESLSEDGKLFVEIFRKMIKMHLRADLSNFYPAIGSTNPNSYIIIDNNIPFYFTNDSIKRLMVFWEIPLEEIDDIHDFLKSKNYFIPTRK